MIEPLYRGSVKDLLGPLTAGGIAGAVEALVFEYTDAYSVFDWGRMPDLLPRKGEALAVMAAGWFDRLENPAVWREFSRSPEAHEIRKANRAGGAFNDICELLQRDGLRTHYLGVLAAAPEARNIVPLRLGDAGKPMRHMAVRRVSAARPVHAQVLGRAVPDYAGARLSPPPRLVPLEVVFRFSCPEGSSLIERVRRDPDYLVTRGYAETSIQPGQKWIFPVLELFTKLEPSDRPLSFSEALAISGIPGERLQELLLKTAWVAALLRNHCQSVGLELADGKLEWAIDRDGGVFLVDAIGPDEFRLLRGGVQLSKEFLRSFYRETHWYSSLNRAKKLAAAQGTHDWKKLVQSPPPALGKEYKELGSHLYMALANAMSGRTWFPEAWPLDKVTSLVSGLVSKGGERS
ncbi:MAG: hypothetical protein A2583_13010 [Bdellovibrionales bacterium RIFOXYD1_FULL_53_11]|nr:MAG: hypothetical protein A2583_13010 [Bdellovibrionales bacterium RIFOXYD1_FULL_53_11]